MWTDIKLEARVTDTHSHHQLHGRSRAIEYQLLAKSAPKRLPFSPWEQNKYDPSILRPLDILLASLPDLPQKQVHLSNDWHIVLFKLTHNG